MGTGGVWVWDRGSIKIPLPLTAAGGEGRRGESKSPRSLASPSQRGLLCSPEGEGSGRLHGGQWASSPDTTPWDAVDISEFRCGQWKRVWWG